MLVKFSFWIRALLLLTAFAWASSLFGGGGTCKMKSKDALLDNCKGTCGTAFASFPDNQSMIAACITSFCSGAQIQSQVDACMKYSKPITSQAACEGATIESNSSAVNCCVWQ